MAACTISAMPRTPGKSGPGRGKTPPKRGAKPAAPKRTSKPASGHASGGSKPPPWMPDAALVKAMKGPQHPRGPDASAAAGGAQRPATREFRDPQAAREAGRYENPIASREAILQLLAAADGPLSAEALAQELDLAAPDRFDALNKRLGAMVRDGQLLQNRKGAYAPAERLDLIAGTVIANPEGFGFLRPESGVGDDLFLPPAEMRKAMHGDRVLGSVTNVDRRGRREGVIVEVLERRLNRLIGRFTLESGISYVVPDDRRIQRNIQIPADERMDAKHGQLVVCEIVHAPDAHRPPIGRVLAVLGDKLTASLAVEAAIHGHEIPHEFPPAALAEATAVPLEVDAATAASRVDLRQLPLVTIDGEDAKDFDDAVYCEPNREGFRLVVAIADVSHYVRPATPLDEEAHQARDVGLLPRLRRADAAGDAVQRHLLAEAEGRPAVFRLRHAGRPRRPRRALEVLRSGHELARAPDLHPGLERGRRRRARRGPRAGAGLHRRAAAAGAAPAPAVPRPRQGAAAARRDRVRVIGSALRARTAGRGHAGRHAAA